MHHHQLKSTEMNLCTCVELRLNYDNESKSN